MTDVAVDVHGRPGHRTYEIGLNGIHESILSAEEAAALYVALGRALGVTATNTEETL